MYCQINYRWYKSSDDEIHLFSHCSPTVLNLVNNAVFTSFFFLSLVPSVKSPKIRQVLTIIHEDEEKNKQQMCCFHLSLLYTCYNVHQSVLFVSCVTCIIRCTFVVPRVILCTAVQTTNMSKFYKKITTKTWKFRKLYWKWEYGHIFFLKWYTASFLCCIINWTTWHLFVCD